MLKEVRYTAFGVIEEDTNPGLYMPIGFAGGLHDRDIGWVRFGYRDYDPLTARFTAKDPLGYKAGDFDLRGYCFDDQVNGAYSPVLAGFCCPQGLPVGSSEEALGHPAFIHAAIGISVVLAVRGFSQFFGLEHAPK